MTARGSRLNGGSGGNGPETVVEWTAPTADTYRISMCATITYGLSIDTAP